MRAFRHFDKLNDHVLIGDLRCAQNDMFCDNHRRSVSATSGVTSGTAPFPAQGRGRFPVGGISRAMLPRVVGAARVGDLPLLFEP